MDDEMKEVNRQIAMGWERGRRYGFVQGFGLAFAAAMLVILAISLMR